VIRHGMAAAGRYLNLRVLIPDVPGGLAELLGDVGAVGAVGVGREQCDGEFDHVGLDGFVGQRGCDGVHGVSRDGGAG